MQKQQNRKIILYISQSIDGYIARSQGTKQDQILNWLDNIENPDKNDYGYEKFLQSIDTTISGNSTYRYVLNAGFPNPYPNQKNYVFTRNKQKSIQENKTSDKNYVQYIDSDIIEFVQQLKIKKSENDKNIWLVGGSAINSILLENDMIDEIILSIAPVIIGNGIKLFDVIPQENFYKNFNLLNTHQFQSGFVQLTYQYKK